MAHTFARSLIVSSDEENMEKWEEALYRLRVANAQVKDLSLERLNYFTVLHDPRFQDAPGGSDHHHNYKHGLIIHVDEVMQNVFSMTSGKPSDDLITAVIWHDYMKIKDYGWEGETIIKLPYHKLINHVTGSAIAFNQAAQGIIPLVQLENIEHLILSHHGRKEWGSPVEPATAEAFILHAADMMSSRGVNL
jgi:3'-5' exoribonuclease